jgi:hypothetical protein
MNKRAVMIIIALGIVIVSGGTTYAVISLIKSKKSGGDQSTSEMQSPKKRADDANAKAKKLISDTVKIGSGKESDKMTQEAAAQFGEASKLYKQAGDNAASYESQANADALSSRLAAEEASKKQLEEEQAKQKADLEAAKAAMAAGH